MTDHKKPTPEDKQIAKHAYKVFGGEAHVREWTQENSPLIVDILSSENVPEPKVTSYATIGLWRTPLTLDGKAAPSRVELVGAYRTPLDVFPEALSGLAFHMMQTQMMFKAGSVMPEYFQEWALETTLPHLYITTPSLWAGDAFADLNVGSAQVTWLQTFPISEAERQFLKSNGSPAFNELLEKKGVDVWDPARLSVV